MMSLVTLFGGLKSLFKVNIYLQRNITRKRFLQVRQYSADNFIFRLHYKVRKERNEFLDDLISLIISSQQGSSWPGVFWSQQYNLSQTPSPVMWRWAWNLTNIIALRISRGWREASSTRIAGPTPPSRCPGWPLTRTLAWGLSPGVAGGRSRSCTAGTSGSGWRCLASHSPSTSDTSYGKVAREGEWRDWCQVRRFILIGKLIRESVHVRTWKLQILMVSMLLAVALP